MQNPYLPYPVRIDEIITETEDKNLKTFKFVFLNAADEEKFAYHAGQFAELSVTGKGEIPIGIASSPTEKGFLKFTVNKVGLVTSYLHAMQVGDFTHETPFTPRSLAQALASCGLPVVRFAECGPIPDRPASICRWLLWQAWRAAQRLVLLVDTGSMGPPVLSPNMACYAQKAATGGTGPAIESC